MTYIVGSYEIGADLDFALAPRASVRVFCPVFIMAGRTSPFPVLRAASAAVGIFCGCAGPGFGQNGLPVAASGALAVECATEPGKTYQVQTSSDLLAWNSENRRFGDGFSFTQWLSGPANAFLRVKVESQPQTLGHAPWSPQGLGVVLNGGSGSSLLKFSGISIGVRTVLPPSGNLNFTYSALRRGENLLEVVLTDVALAVQRIQFHFLSAEAGTYECFDYQNGQLIDSEAGAFALTESLNLLPAQAPAGLESRKIVFSDGGIPELAAISGAGVSTVREANITKSCSPSYATTSGQSASLSLQFGPGHSDAVELTFTSSHGGTFVRTQQRSGGLPDSDTGVFVVTDVAGE